MELDPDYTGAYYIRGLAYEKSGQIDKSIEDFTTVLEIDPNHVNAAFARAACENKTGNYLKAIEDYNMALKLDSERGQLAVPRQKLNDNLGMSYVVPTSHEQFLSASKGRSRGRGDKKSFDFNITNSEKNDTQADLISTGGTNSFLEGGENTPSMLGQVCSGVITHFIFRP